MSLSDGWRLNKSVIPTLELALVLRALRKVIGTMSPDGVETQFTSGATRTEKNDPETGKTNPRIYINPTIALTEDWPLRADKMDVLVGLAAHEAAHRLFEMPQIATISRLIRELRFIKNATLSQYPDQHRLVQTIEDMTLQTFVDIGEEVYVDHHTATMYPIQGTYIQLARTHEQKPTEWDRVQLSLEGLLTQHHVYNETIPQEVLDTTNPMVWSILDSFYKSLRVKDLTVREREQEYATTWSGLINIETQKQRQEKAQQALHNLTMGKVPSTSSEMAKEGFQQTQTPPPLSHKDGGDAREEAKDKLEGSGLQDGEELENITNKELGIATTQVPTGHQEGLIDSANTMADDSDIEEMVDQINTSLKHPIQSASVMLEPWKTNVLQSDYDKILSKDLEGLERLKNATGNEIRRAVPEGRIDRGRLAHHKTTERIKRRTVKKAKQKLSIIMLLDSSGSMSDHSDIFLNSKAIFDANISGTTHVYAYDTVRGNYVKGGGRQYGTVSIRNLTWDGQFHEVHARGGTPSGEALIAVAIKHPNSLIIHFSDGYPNDDSTVEDAAVAIQRDYPQTLVLNIILDDNGKNPTGMPEVYSDAESRRFKSILIKDQLDYPKVVVGQLREWTMMGLL